MAVYGTTTPQKEIRPQPMSSGLEMAAKYSLGA